MERTQGLKSSATVRRRGAQQVVRLGVLVLAMTVLPGANGFLTCGGFGLTEAVDESKGGPDGSSQPAEFETKFSDRMNVVEQGGVVEYGLASNEFVVQDGVETLRTTIKGRLYSEIKFFRNGYIHELADTNLDGVIDYSRTREQGDDHATTVRVWYGIADGLIEAEETQTTVLSSGVTVWNITKHNRSGGVDIVTNETVEGSDSTNGMKPAPPFEVPVSSSCPKEGSFTGDIGYTPSPLRHTQSASPGSWPDDFLSLQEVSGTQAGSVNIITKSSNGVYCEKEEADVISDTFQRAWSKMQKCMCKYAPSACGSLDTMLKQRGLLISCGLQREKDTLGKASSEIGIVLIRPDQIGDSAVMLHELEHIADRQIDRIIEPDGKYHGDHRRTDPVYSCQFLCQCDAATAKGNYFCYNELCAKCAESPELCRNQRTVKSNKPCGPGAPADICAYGSGDCGCTADKCTDITWSFGGVCQYADSWWCDGRPRNEYMDRYICTASCGPGVCPTMDVIPDPVFCPVNLEPYAALNPDDLSAPDCEDVPECLKD